MKIFLDLGVPLLPGSYLVTNGGSCFLPDSLKASLAADGLTPVRGAPKFVRQLNIAYHSGSPRRELIERVLTFFSGVKV